MSDPVQCIGCNAVSHNDAGKTRLFCGACYDTKEPAQSCNDYAPNPDDSQALAQMREACATLSRKADAYQELRAATDAYMNQPGMSCYATKSDWRADSDIRGQRVLDALAALTGTERKPAPASDQFWECSDCSRLSPIGSGDCVHCTRERTKPNESK